MLDAINALDLRKCSFNLDDFTALLQHSVSNRNYYFFYDLVLAAASLATVKRMCF